MVVMQRSEVHWYHNICSWALLCSFLMLFWLLWLLLESKWEGKSSILTLGTILVGLLCLAFIAFSLVGLWRFRKRSRVILYKQGDEILLLSDKSTEEGFKFQFLRDVVAENVVNRYRGDHASDLPVAVEGFHMALVFLNANHPLIVRYCKMLFDDVYLNDPDHVWIHYDSGNTFDPHLWDKAIPNSNPPTKPVENAQTAAN